MNRKSSKNTIVKTHTIKRGPELMMSLPSHQKPKHKVKKSVKGVVSKKPHKGDSHIHKHIQSGHGVKYLMALSNPFHEMVRGVHVPDPSAQASFKTSGKGRVVVSIPASSQLMFFPQYSTASDTPFGLTISGTIASFAGASAVLSYPTAPVGLTYTVLTNAGLPFTQNTLYSGRVGFRQVVSGIKVRYTGTVLNRGGTAIWYEDPSHYQGIFTPVQATGTTLTAMSAIWGVQPNARYTSFNSADEHEFIWSPQVGAAQQTGAFENLPQNQVFGTGDGGWVATENGYTPVRFGDTAAGQVISIPREVLILRNSTATAAIEFTIEFITHAEFTGGTVTAMHTPSPVHVQDAVVVKNLIAQSKHTHAQSPDVHPSRHVSDLMGTFENLGRTVVNTATTAAFNAARDPANVARLASMVGAFML